MFKERILSLEGSFTRSTGDCPLLRGRREIVKPGFQKLARLVFGKKLLNG